MEKIKKYKFLLLIPILFLVIFSFIYYNSKNSEESLEVIEEVIEPVVEVINEVKKIKIDIKGAVKKEGVYEINENSRVIDAINMSGGLNKNADTSTINLSKVLSDQDVIIIYTKEELVKIREGNVVVKYVEKECICPKLEENKACIETTATNTDSKLVNLNRASKEELMTIPNIGESKADDIIAYRSSTKFKAIEEIKNIKGIGDSIFEKIKEFIEV